MDIQAQALSEDNVPNSRSARYSHRGNAASVSRSELHSFVCGSAVGHVAQCTTPEEVMESEDISKWRQ